MARPWIGFFIRGFFAALLSIGLFLPDTTAKIAEIYIGFFFLANGVFSLKLVKELKIREKLTTVAALVSLLGGITVIVLRFTSPIIDMSDLGKYLFPPIAIIIGLFQILGLVHVTPEFDHKVVRQPHQILGLLEVLLGIAIFIYEPIDWQVKILAHIWIILVALLMLTTAYRLRKIEMAHLPQPTEQK